jgi:hypothetical protein
VLNNQQEVNQFISKFGKCTEVNHLIINDVNADITQLDSLQYIERVKCDLRLNFKRTNENTKDLNGLRNLKFAKILSINFYKIKGKLSQLYDVEELGLVNMNNTVEEVLTILPSLKYIENRLDISGYFSEEATPKFNTGNNFSLEISGNLDTTSQKVLSHRIKKENLKTLIIFPSDGIDLSHLSILDSVENLRLAYCGNSDFSNIESIRTLKSFTLQNDLGNNVYGNGLKYIQNIDQIWLSNNKFRLDLMNLFPNIMSINDRLSIRNQDSLTHLKFLDNVSPPVEPNEFNTVNISNNIRLNDCNTSFLCEALARYPESVIIQNNGPKCTKEEILKYCQTVSTKDTDKHKLVISPNPTYGYVNIKNLEQPVSVTIFNLSGQVVKTMIDIDNEINIEDLPQGMYILDFRNHQISEQHKVLKVE